MVIVDLTLRARTDEELIGDFADLTAVHNFLTDADAEALRRLAEIDVEIRRRGL